MPAPRTDYPRDTQAEGRLRTLQKRIAEGAAASDERKEVVAQMFHDGYPLAAIADVINSVEGGPRVTAGAVQKMVARR